MRVAVLLAVFAAAVGIALAEPPLTVHLVPHSHTDPGWTNRFEGYTSTAWRILQTVVQSLVQDSELRFVWSEVSFLRSWYDCADPRLKQNLTTLIKQGRMEIVGGGLVMPDETVADAEMVVEAMKFGHQWVLEEFGVRPRVAWQVNDKLWMN